MYMATSDEELAHAVAGGDAAALSKLLERRYDSLFALCFRLTGSRAGFRIDGISERRDFDGKPRLFGARLLADCNWITSFVAF